MANEIQKDLKKIERELEQIRKQGGKASWKQTIFTGILHGAGWILGTILAAVLIGWILSILGVVPGFNEIVDDLQSGVDARSRF